MALHGDRAHGGGGRWWRWTRCTPTGWRRSASRWWRAARGRCGWCSTRWHAGGGRAGGRDGGVPLPGGGPVRAGRSARAGGWASRRRSSGQTAEELAAELPAVLLGAELEGVPTNFGVAVAWTSARRIGPACCGAALSMPVETFDAGRAAAAGRGAPRGAGRRRPFPGGLARRTPARRTDGPAAPPAAAGRGRLSGAAAAGVRRRWACSGCCGSQRCAPEQAAPHRRPHIRRTPTRHWRTLAPAIDPSRYLAETMRRSTNACRRTAACSGRPRPDAAHARDPGRSALALGGGGFHRQAQGAARACGRITSRPSRPRRCPTAATRFHINGHAAGPMISFAHAPARPFPSRGSSG